MTGGEVLRIVLILLILGSLWRCMFLLWRDWRRIEPVYWRPIITAFHLVLFANATVVTFALTEGVRVTSGTWLFVGSYVVLAAVALVAPYSERATR